MTRAGPRPASKGHRAREQGAGLARLASRHGQASAKNAEDQQPQANSPFQGFAVVRQGPYRAEMHQNGRIALGEIVEPAIAVGHVVLMQAIYRLRHIQIGDAAMKGKAQPHLQIA